jgi:restriction system-associated AAA family ATPase
MKLLRLKITDRDGFRSLPCGFEHHFRTEWTLKDEFDHPEGFAPFVCAGPNGSGKSNLLEALAAIFFRLELQRVRRSFLPKVFDHHPIENPQGIKESDGHPNAFELEYLIHLPGFAIQDAMRYAHVRVLKDADTSPQMFWVNAAEFGDRAEDLGDDGLCRDQHRELPEFVLGYSSGENQILSLPFFKTRFLQFDEYWTSLRDGQAYPGHPATRLTYLDSGFSQAILLCNLLFASSDQLEVFSRDVGIEALKEFRIVLRRSVLLDEAHAAPFITPIERVSSPPDDVFQARRGVVSVDDSSGRYRLNVLALLEEHRPDKQQFSSLALDALRRCATLEYHDEASDTLVLDFWVNDKTRQAFQESFDRNPLALFQAFQVLLTLNLYTVSDSLKTDLYKSGSDYVSETVPTLASDQRVMRFKFVRFSKQGVQQPMMLKALSDGEHQLLHSLGLCLLFRDTNSLFLLDEPETHFDPDWRAGFISRLKRCLAGREGVSQEMLITTHSPFLISDSKPGKVLVFEKDRNSGHISIRHPTYNTLGASINKITMNTFNKRETVGGVAQKKLQDLRRRFQQGEAASDLIAEMDRELGDSVEKVLLVNAMLDGTEQPEGKK